MGDAHKPEEKQEGYSAIWTDIAIAEVEKTHSGSQEKQDFLEGKYDSLSETAISFKKKEKDCWS